MSLVLGEVATVLGLDEAALREEMGAVHAVSGEAIGPESH
jgi:hypothetical protein